jgi:predicted  nucleic acid-binding Zn-ribbon protein
MTKKPDDNYRDVLLEEMNGKFDMVLEMVGYLRENMATKSDIRELRDELSEVKGDVKAIKFAVTNMSGDIDDHEKRITKLERKAA